MNAIEINGLTKKYKDFTLDNISFVLPSGCIMGIIGENGSGKTTTIKSILGLINPDSGTINVFGKKLDREAKNYIGAVLDDTGIPIGLNAKDINSVMKYAYTEWDENAFFALMDKYELPIRKKVSDYSKGMTTKLKIAIAISHNARLLVLDEPTEGLDPLARDEFINIINDFTRDENHSVLLSSHIISDLEKICDYITFISRGKLMLCEEKDKLYEQYGIIHMTEQQLIELSPGSIKGQKRIGENIEAIVDKTMLPNNTKTSPINIEELFVFMAKKEEAH